MSVGADILAALKTRLERITVDNGYLTDVKTVRVDTVEPTLSASSDDMPLIEVKDDAETYEHEASTAYWANTIVCLFLVGPPDWSDARFQDWLTDIRRCLYGNGPSASGNTGLPLAPRVSAVELVDAASDLNMLSSVNRTYLMRIRLRSLRITYRD